MYNKEFLKTYKPLLLSCIQISIRSDASCISDGLLFFFPECSFLDSCNWNVIQHFCEIYYIICLSEAILFLKLLFGIHYIHAHTYTHFSRLINEKSSFQTS